MPGYGILQRLAWKTLELENGRVRLGENRLRAAMRFTIAEQRLKNFTQRAPTAQDTGFHRAHAALENFSDFFIAEAFEVAQNYRAAKYVRYLLQSVLHGVLNLSRGELLEGRSAKVFDINVRMAFFRFGIDGDVFLQMALEPAAMIERFAYGDAIQPGFQGAAAAKSVNAAKGLKKDFLRAVRGIGHIAEHA